MSNSPTDPDAIPYTGTVRVLLVDDQHVVAEAVRAMLDAEPGLEFFSCTDPAAAIATANKVRPTIILQDLVMPEIDGMLLVKFFRANPATAETPVMVLSSRDDPETKAEAFAGGANDYIVKLPDRLELVARVRYHSRAYVNLLQRNAAVAETARQRKQLANQIAAGERYVRGLLPKPWKPGDDPAMDAIDWRFAPAATMGGDALGYHRLDDANVALYVLDVTGHGLDSALLGVTVLNTIRGGTLRNADFTKPGEVLFALNEAFPAERHGEKFFTAWYGIYHGPTRTLTWSGAGHPPALLYADPTSGAEPQKLESQGPMIGMMPWPEFETGSVSIPPGAWLYIYSDGTHEIHKVDGDDWTFPEFVATLTGLVQSDPDRVIDALHTLCVSMNGSAVLDDDFTVVEVRFPSCDDAALDES